MARKKKHPEHVNHERWLVSYADFITLLFAFFVVMFAVSQVDGAKLGRFTESFKGAVEWELFERGHNGLLPDEMPHNAPEASQEQSEAEDKAKYVNAREAIRRELLDKLGSSGDFAGLKLIDVHGELVLRLPETLLFSVGQAEVQKQGERLLAAIARVLITRPVRVRVEGHTDSAPIHTGRFPSNWDLSTARATAVINYWIETMNFDPKRLAAAGYAEFHPVASNATPEGKAQNRRVDIIIVAADPDDPDIVGDGGVSRRDAGETMVIEAGVETATAAGDAATDGPARDAAPSPDAGAARKETR